MSESEPSTDIGGDLRVPRRRRGLGGVGWRVLGAVSGGGALGALARWGLGVRFPPGRTGFPWATFAINVSGCLLIGVLMVLVAEVWTGRRLVRAFLGVGVLGGYTTFSAYVVDVQRLVGAGAPAIALAYLAATPVAALAATYAGTGLTRVILSSRVILSRRWR